MVNILKISLLVIAVLTLGYLAFEFLYDADEVEKESIQITSVSENETQNYVESKIEELKALNLDSFSKEAMKGVLYDIEDFFNRRKFSDNVDENDRLRDVLTKKLFSVYLNRFLKECQNIFSGEEWEHSKLNFIKDEIANLKNNELLEKNSPTDLRLDSLNDVVDSYYAVVAFIKKCETFSVEKHGLNHKFPFNKAQRFLNYIDDKKTYVAEHEPLKNSQKLSEDLSTLSFYLYAAHKDYLEKKFELHGANYTGIRNQLTYNDSIFSVLEGELYEFDNEPYGVSTDSFNIHWSFLQSKLDTLNVRAYQHFSDLNKW